MLAVREQICVGIDAGRRRTAEAGRAEVLLLGPVVELRAGLIERVVAPAEPAERLALRRLERVADRGDAGGLVGPGRDLDRAVSGSGLDIDDQAPPARIARRHDQAQARAVVGGSLDRDGAVLGAALGDRLQVAVPLKGRVLVDRHVADEEGKRRIQGRGRRSRYAELRARHRRDDLRRPVAAGELSQHRPAGSVGEADPERVEADIRRGTGHPDAGAVGRDPRRSRLSRGRGRDREQHGEGRDRGDRDSQRRSGRHRRKPRRT